MSQDLIFQIADARVADDVDAAFDQGFGDRVCTAGELGDADRPDAGGVAQLHHCPGVGTYHGQIDKQAGHGLGHGFLRWTGAGRPGGEWRPACLLDASGLYDPLFTN